MFSSRVPSPTENLPAAIARAREDFQSALSTRPAVAIVAAQEELRLAQVAREAARENLAVISCHMRMDGGGRSTQGDAHHAAIATEQAAARDVITKRVAVREARERAAPRISAALSEPLAEIQRAIFELLSRLEEACDPLTELQANLNRHGLEVPTLVASAPPMLEHIRAVRRIAGGR